MNDPDAPVIDRAAVRAQVESIFAAAAGGAATEVARLSTGAEDEAVRLRAAGAVIGHFADRVSPGPGTAVQINNYMKIPEIAAVAGKEVPSITIGTDKLMLPAPAPKKLPNVIRPEQSKQPVKQSFGIDALGGKLPASPKPRELKNVEPLTPKSPKKRPVEVHAKIETIK